VKISALVLAVAIMISVGCSGVDDEVSQSPVDTPQLPASQPTIVPTIEPTAQPQELQITPTHSLSLRIPDAIGVNIHRVRGPETDAVIFDSLEQIGVGVIRDDLYWEVVEQAKGVYDFIAYDEFFERMESLDIRVLWLIDRSNSLYEDEPRAITTVEGRKAYAAFVGAAAERYKGKNIIWEIWNEPNSPQFWKPEPNAQDYSALVELAAQAIHEADPSATVVGPSSSLRPLESYFGDLEWYQNLFQSGLLKHVDAVSIHPYRALAPPETAIEDYETLMVAVPENSS
jgi:hypothetical protein